MPNAQLGLPAPGAAGSLGANKAIVISAPSAGSRQAKFWAGNADHPYNTPIMSGVTYTAQGMSTSDPTQTIRTRTYGTTFNNCGYGVLTQNDGIENHNVYLQGDQISAQDTYGMPGTAGFWTSAVYQLKISSLVNLGEGACKWPSFFGVIRDYDVFTLGAIPHALNLWLLNTDLFANTPHGTGGQGTGWVFPAWGQDGDANSGKAGAQYLGNIPIGARLGIPRTTVKPALSANGSMIWDALVTFGGFVTNRSGNATLQSEATSDGRLEAWCQTLRNNGDINKCFQALRMIQLGQITASQPGGPGAPPAGFTPPPAFV